MRIVFLLRVVLVILNYISFFLWLEISGIRRLGVRNSDKVALAFSMMWLICGILNTILCLSEM